MPKHNKLSQYLNHMETAQVMCMHGHMHHFAWPKHSTHSTYRCSDPMAPFSRSRQCHQCFVYCRSSSSFRPRKIFCLSWLYLFNSTGFCVWPSLTWIAFTLCILWIKYRTYDRPQTFRNDMSLNASKKWIRWKMGNIIGILIVDNWTISSLCCFVDLFSFDFGG